GPRRISHDNWIIDGCPHTGPSLTSNAQGLHVVWFTAGGAPGVYFTSSEDQGQTFSLRNKISDQARHPQMATLSDDRLALVWDEMQSEPSGPVHAGRHQEEYHGVPAIGSKVVLQIRNGPTVLNSFTLSSPGINASFPVLSIMEGKILVAWSQQNQGKSAIYYCWVDLAAGGIKS